MITQKIRIKVLIGNSGNYCGYGWRGAEENAPDDTIYDVVDCLSTKAYWLTAEIPIPGTEEKEVEAVVEEIL